MMRNVLLFICASLGMAAAPRFTLILGQPTDRSITVNARADAAVELYFEYGVKTGLYTGQTKAQVAAADPNFAGFYLAQTVLSGLQADTQYFYRLRYRTPGAGGEFTPGAEYTFHTQRLPGSSFVFCIQGDSHPERERVMFNSELYAQTLNAAAKEKPDFYLTSGDDFSVDTLPTPYTASAVTGRYTLQLPYLDLVARSAALFLQTGNHEETSLSNYNLPPDAANSNKVPVWAQSARNLYYPVPGPDDPATGTFYTGNATTLPGIGQLRDYYAWHWGDALFVVIDPYWSSPVQVDTGLGGQNGAGGRTNDKWAITHGDAQYEWLKKTLQESKAKWKFVFAHHVMGTGRGGVEIADQFEWGGNSANGRLDFPAKRPAWPMPIHRLMVENKVTIFFQAHDHIFAHQQLDGVTYQSLPNPADNTYTAFNADAFKSGEVFPGAGYVKVAVGPQNVRVEYIRQWLPKDETPSQTSGKVQFAYTIPSGGPGPAPVIASVANAAGGGAAIAPNTWVEIKGSNLAAGVQRIWTGADFAGNRLPVTVEGVSVTVNGKPAYVYYVSPTQVNVLTPPDALPATVAVQVTVNGVTGAAFSAPGQALSPSLFRYDGSPHVAAVHGNGALVGPAALYPGASTPARPGETILLYGNGFGPTTVPVAAGAPVQAGALAVLPAVRIGERAATVTFAGLVAPGQFQFNAVVPEELADGDQPVSVSYGGLTTQAGSLLAVQR